MTTAVAALAMPGMLWCSASQKRVKPSASACCASDRLHAVDDAERADQHLARGEARDEPDTDLPVEAERLDRGLDEVAEAAAEAVLEARLGALVIEAGERFVARGLVGDRLGLGHSRVELRFAYGVAREGEQRPEHDRDRRDDRARVREERPGALPHGAQHVHGLRPAVRGQLEEERRLRSLEDGALDHRRRTERGDDAQHVHREERDRARLEAERGARTRREGEGDDERVHRQPSAARHERQREHRDEAVAAALDRARRHDRGHRAREARQERHERAAVQPHAPHHAIDHERDAREVARVLEHHDEQREQRDLRHEDDHIAHAGDHAVGQQLGERPLRHRTAHEILCSGDGRLDRADEGLGPREERLEEHGHHAGEHEETPGGMREHRVDLLARAPGLRRALHGRLDDAIDDRVARRDQLLVERALAVSLAIVGVALGVQHGRTQGGGHVGELVVADRQERPARERRAPRGDAGRLEALGRRPHRLHARLDRRERTGHPRRELEPRGLGRRGGAIALGAPSLEQRAEGVTQRIEALSGARRHGDHGHAERAAHGVGVDGRARRARLVDHVEADQRRQARLEDLHGQVEMPLERACVGDEERRVRTDGVAREDLVDGDLLLRGARRERVGAGHVRELHGHRSERDARRAAIHGDARVVARAGARAGERVEERGLAGVRVAGDDHAEGRAHVRSARAALDARRMECAS
jgi:hypothetical protein